MVCPQCAANIVQKNDMGETVLRTRGIILKSDRLSLICPKCKGDVPMSQTLTKALQDVAILFFKRS